MALLHDLPQLRCAGHGGIVLLQALAPRQSVYLSAGHGLCLWVVPAVFGCVWMCLDVLVWKIRLLLSPARTRHVAGHVPCSLVMWPPPCVPDIAAAGPPMLHGAAVTAV